MRLLVIITGPSHSGKTSTATRALKRIDHRAAHVAIDEIIKWLAMGPEGPWESGLPVAYDIAAATCKVLLEKGLVVLFESTFTYIPRDAQDAEFHDQELRRFVNVAKRTAASCVAVRFTASASDVMDRNIDSGRFDQSIVRGIWELHAELPSLEVPTYVIDASADNVEVAAEHLVTVIRSYLTRSAS